MKNVSLQNDCLYFNVTLINSYFINYEIHSCVLVLLEEMYIPENHNFRAFHVFLIPPNWFTNLTSLGRVHYFKDCFNELKKIVSTSPIIIWI